MAKTYNEKYGPWAIVAGAAEGLGEAFCIELARRNINLLMIDNQGEKLRLFQKTLEEKYAIQTIGLDVDLSSNKAATSILEASKEVDVGLLVYVGAYSLIKPFLHINSSELDSFVDVNARTQLHLVHGFSKRLQAQNRVGGILLMSSLAGLIGMQLVAPYAATKAFTWNLSESLHSELKPYHIDVLSCLAGVTDTPAYRKSSPRFGFFKPQIMQPSQVAVAALRQLGKKTRFIPGFSNRLNYFILTRLMPRKMAASLANKTMGKMYAHHNTKKE